MSPITRVYPCRTRRPFWGFAELFLVAALFLPAVFAGEFAVRAREPLPAHRSRSSGFLLLVAEFIGYGIIFVALRVLFARTASRCLNRWVGAASVSATLHL